MHKNLSAATDYFLNCSHRYEGLIVALSLYKFKYSYDSLGNQAAALII